MMARRFLFKILFFSNISALLHTEGVRKRMASIHHRLCTLCQWKRCQAIRTENYCNFLLAYLQPHSTLNTDFPAPFFPLFSDISLAPALVLQFKFLVILGLFLAMTLPQPSRGRKDSFLVGSYAMTKRGRRAYVSVSYVCVCIVVLLSSATAWRWSGLSGF